MPHLTLDPPAVRAPEFPPGLGWVRAAGLPAIDSPPAVASPTGTPLSVAALRGRVAVVDLWTYGCINCQHVAPELRALERRFGPALAVVGVHSGKFIAEREAGRIAHAAARLGVGHPVANDRQFRAWRAWAARGWPTLAVVDARGYVRFQQSGERRAAELAPLVAALLDEARAEGGLAEDPWPWAGPDADVGLGAPPADVLRYPSAVAAGPAAADGTRPFAVADAGHHRVLVGRLARDGRTFRVVHVVGAGHRTRDRCPALDGWDRAPGDALDRATFAACADGAANRASFDRPQGLAWCSADDGAPVLYVADTGNHAIRAVNPATGAVHTVAGTGVRLRTRGDRRAGALVSPWGVLALAGADVPVLLVAMAGTHELWRVDPRTGAAGPVAGGRGEALVDGPPADALLAQPAGLATDGRRVWWTDAESSAVRETTLAALGVGRPDGGDAAAPVRTLIGTGLFDFGLADGVGDAARFQHPQGIAWVPLGSVDGGARLLVADSYNDVLRWVDPATRTADTWLGGFAEPGGLCVAGGLAYVADTNAHRVAVVALAGGAVETLAVRAG